MKRERDKEGKRGIRRERWREGDEEEKKGREG